MRMLKVITREQSLNSALLRSAARRLGSWHDRRLDQSRPHDARGVHRAGDHRGLKRGRDVLRLPVPELHAVGTCCQRKLCLGMRTLNC